MTRSRRPGIVLPAVLAVMVALSLLASLALFFAVQEWRVAQLAGDRVTARAAALVALSSAHHPPALELLCLSPPSGGQERATPAGASGSAEVRWQHLGGGAVLVEITGRGRRGSRARLLALFRPDSVEFAAGLLRCPAATRLLRLAGRWVEGHPEG